MLEQLKARITMTTKAKEHGGVIVAKARRVSSGHGEELIRLCSASSKTDTGRVA
jgi:hypothetical protein